MRRIRTGGLSLAAMLLLTLAGGAAAAPAPGFTELASVSGAGTQGNQDSERPAVSADGRYVAFASFADNLVPEDTNGAADVFVRDRLTGATERVSVTSAGREADSDSGLVSGMRGPSLSADGRYVAFDSNASNLAKGDRNESPDVFVHDRVTGTTELVSAGADGSPAGGTEATISDDGTHVAFVSFAETLVAPDTNFTADVFVHDRTTGTTVRVDGADGSEANGQSFGPDLNGDGRFVAFSSWASNLATTGADDGGVDVFVHDLATGVTEAVSGPEAGGSFVVSDGASITPDGRFVVFETADPTLVPDANGFTRDVLLYDRAAGTHELVSVGEDGAAGDDWSVSGAASADGRFVAFASFAGNLVAEDGNSRWDVFVRDRELGTTRRVSVGTGGEEGDLDSLAPAISADGLVTAFHSRATTFVAESGQDFFANDVFVRDARPTADLALALADSPDPATARAELTYTATIANDGPAAATAVTLLAELPADASLVSVTGATCAERKSKSSEPLTCDVGTLAAGASATVTIVVEPKSDGTIALAARVRAEQPDADPADNSATETTAVVR